jgi:hypothetical protein
MIYHVPRRERKARRRVGVCFWLRVHDLR